MSTALSESAIHQSQRRITAGLERRLCLAGCMAALTLVALFPGDVPWISDECLLISSALQSNASHTLARAGLIGTHGVPYGPLPTWIYQVYLAFSNNLVGLTAIRGALFIVTLALCLLRISRLAGITLSGIPILLLSPYLWLYSRQLWDNSFNIPLSLIALLSYCEFLHGRRWLLGLTTASLGGMLLVHLMSVPVVLAVILHALLYRRKELWNARWPLLAGVSIVAMIGARYFAEIANHLDRSGEKGWPSVHDLLFGLSGGQWFGLAGWARIVGEDWWSAAPGMLKALAFGSAVSNLFVLLGIGVAVGVLSREMLASPSRKAIAFISLVSIAIQTIYFGVSKASDQIHYYNASWFAYGCLIWLAIDLAQSRLRFGRYIPLIWAGMLLLSITLLSVTLHKTHGTRSLQYGPALVNQVNVAKIISDMPAGSRIIPLVPAVASIPERITVLVSLLDRPKPPSAAARTAYIVYGASSPSDGRISVVFDEITSPPAPANEQNTVPTTR